MTLDRAFHSSNYVGTYEIREFEGDRYIVSIEKVDDNNSALKKREIFKRERIDNYITPELANTNPHDEDAIIKYCNRYGLPCSSVTIYDRYPEYVLNGVEVEEDEYEKYDPFYKNDRMACEEFRRFVYLAQSLLGTKAALDDVSRNPKKLMHHLIYLLIYSRKFLYDYAPGDARAQTICMRFQYFFQAFQKGFKVVKASDESEYPEELKLHSKLFAFVNAMRDNHSFIMKLLSQSDIIDLGEGQMWTRILDFLYQLLVKDNNVIIEVDDNGDFFLKDEVRYTGDLSELYDLARIVLLDCINEGLSGVTPWLSVDDDKIIHGDWNVPYQYHVIYLELFMILSSKSMVRRCADPSCGNFFSLEQSRADRKYCCRECGLRVAKRKQRERAKQQKK